MHDSPWKKDLVVNILTMIVDFQGHVIKTPLCYIHSICRYMENSPESKTKERKVLT